MADLDLLLLFSENVGAVVSCHIERKKGSNVGYVEFANPEHQKVAIQEFDNQLIELGNADPGEENQEEPLSVRVGEIYVLEAQAQE